MTLRPLALLFGLTMISSTAIAQQPSKLQPAPNNTQAVAAKILTDYQTFLAAQGLSPSVDSDGDVRFTRNERGYFIEVNEDDPTFYRLVLYNIWPIESEAERMKALAACNQVNSQLKVAKAYVTNDNVWVAVELFLDSPDQYKGTFDRTLRTIDRAVDVFVSQM
ncbi:MAG: YbjN domain-containing protein [Myxococcota bacterium]